MQQTNSMNKSVTNLWNTQKNDSSSSTPLQSGTTTPVLAGASTPTVTSPVADATQTTAAAEDKKTSSKKRSKGSGGGNAKRVRSKYIFCVLMKKTATFCKLSNLFVIFFSRIA